MEQIVQRVIRIMNASYNVSYDQIVAMSEQTKALAEQIVLIFGVETVSSMGDLEILKLGKLIDTGFSMGFKTGFRHAKSSIDKGRTI